MAEYNLGNVKGQQGEKGEKGEKGISLSEVAYVESFVSGGENKMKFIFTDGTESDEFIVKNGKDGKDGKNGIDGKVGTIKIGTVETGEAGTNAKVENVGTNNDAILNFTLPKGESEHYYAGKNIKIENGVIHCDEGVTNFKGTVEFITEVDLETVQVGDMWRESSTSEFFVWNGYNFEGIGTYLHTQDFVKTINSKTPTNNAITLTGDDISATYEGTTKSINEILPKVAATNIDDSSTQSNKTWSSQKITTTLNESLAKQTNHNIPRLTPKDITSYYTDGTLWQRLNGTNGFSLFEDIYVGDYIKMSRAITVQNSYDGTVGSQYVTIAGINTLQGNGDTVDMMYNHLVMVAGQGFGGTQHFGRRRMNADHTTVGGYVGSEMYTTHIGGVATSGNVNGNINQQLYAEFGTHLKTTRELLSNSINASGYNRLGLASGCSNNWAWYSCQAVLMSEVECYGSTVWSSSGYDTGNANQQLPLFRHSTKAQNDRSAWYWLKDVASSSYFCLSHSSGVSDYGGAGFDNNFVRPRFAIA